MMGLTEFTCEGIDFIKEALDQLEMKRNDGNTIEDFSPFEGEMIRELESSFREYDRASPAEASEILEEYEGDVEAASEDGHGIDDADDEGYIFEDAYFYSNRTIQNWIDEKRSEESIKAMARVFALKQILEK